MSELIYGHTYIQIPSAAPQQHNRGDSSAPFSFLSIDNQSALFTHPMTFQSLLHVHCCAPQRSPSRCNPSFHLFPFSHLLLPHDLLPDLLHNLCLLLKLHLTYSMISTWSPWRLPRSPPDVFPDLLLISSTFATSSMSSLIHSTTSNQPSSAISTVSPPWSPPAAQSDLLPDPFHDLQLIPMIFIYQIFLLLSHDWSDL